MWNRFREQAGSHRGLVSNPQFVAKPDNCGSGLAREGGVPATINVECGTAFASRLAPTGAWCRTRNLSLNRTIVGAGLPAKAVCQPPSMLNVEPLSRAGSLPQGLGVEPAICR